MNKLTDLINKIERRLGTDIINLPPQLQKDKWVEVIEKDTLETFSRYIPHAIKVLVNTKDVDEEGFSWVDTGLPDSVQILGIRDIDWASFGMIHGGASTPVGFGIYDVFSSNYGLNEIGLLQMNADILSLYNTGIYPEFRYPNKIRFKTAAGSAAINFQYNAVPLTLLITHSKDLSSIPPTKMELFENLATADVASFLYEKLKYFDSLETVFANVDIRIDYIKERAAKRDDYVNELKEGYVSAANTNQPIMYTV